MSVIDEVKQRTDIVEVVSQYATLTKAGRTFRALCPFHSEKRPSFFVYPEQQSWHCFGACSTGGDVFSFVMKKQDIDFGEALRLLAQRAGVTIPSRFEQETGKDERERLYQANEAAAQYFHNLLLNSPAGEKARKYVASRGFSPKTITDFQLGFGLGSWEALKQYLLERGYTESELLDGGLIVATEEGKTHDRFRNRLLFPIKDGRGRTTGFGARVLDDSLPTYLNSPATPIFDKSSSLYGINLATPAIRQQDLAVIVEGYMDVITAHQNGFTNVVAAMGTSVTEKQVSALKRLTRNIVLALDADTAGEEATKRGGEIAIKPSEGDLEDISINEHDRPILFLNEGDVRKLRILGPKFVGQGVLDTDISVFVLPSGKDPDDVIREDVGNWQHLVKEAIPVLDYIFDSVTSELDLATARGKSIALENLLPIVATISNSVHHAHYQQKLARLVEMSIRDLQDAEAALKPSRDKRKIADTKQKTVARAVQPILSSRLEEDCLALLLQHPQLKNGSEGLLPEYFGNSENREIFIAWQQTDDVSALKAQLDTAVWEHLDSLTNKNILATQIEERYNKYVLRLREEYLRGLERKREAVFTLEAESGGTGADLAKLEEEGIETAIQLREVFTQKARRGQGQRR